MLTENEVVDRDTTAESTTSIAIDWYVGNNEWEQLAQFESYPEAKAWVKSPNGTLEAGDRIRYVIITHTVAYEDVVSSETLPKI